MRIERPPPIIPPTKTKIGRKYPEYCLITHDIGSTDEASVAKKADEFTICGTALKMLCIIPLRFRLKIIAGIKNKGM
jgi:hypothetical protein